MIQKSSFLSIFAILSLLTHFSSTLAFPSYNSLAGLSGRELDELVARLPQVLPPNPPGPLAFSGPKLVNDAGHPWKPLRPGDIRGPCPGLNTLASHGVSPHSICALFSLPSAANLFSILSTCRVTESPLLHRLSTPFRKVRHSWNLRFGTQNTDPIVPQASTWTMEPLDSRHTPLTSWMETSSPICSVLAGRRRRLARTRRHPQLSAV